MSMTTARDLIKSLSEYDEDEVLVYTVYSADDLYTLDVPTESEALEIWGSISGAVDKALGYAEEEINQSLADLVGEYFKEKLAK